VHEALSDYGDIQRTRTSYDVLEHFLGALRVIRKSDSFAVASGACCAADTVDVLAQVPRHLRVRPSAAASGGLEVRVYEALRYWCMRP
jgi:hypothetical protein